MRLFLAISLFLMLWAREGYAEQSPALGALVREALENSPEIKAARSNWQAMLTRPAQESSLPNPEIGAGYKNVGFDRITLGEDDFAELQVYASQQFPFPGKLRLKGKVAGHEAQSSGSSLESLINRVEFEVRAAYLDLFLANKSRAVESKNKELLERFASVAKAGYEAGFSSQTDLVKAQLQISASIDALETLDAEGEVASARLGALLNRPPASAPIAVPSELTPSPLDYTLDELYSLADARNPEIVAKRKYSEAAEASLELRRREYFPDIVAEISWFNRGGFTDEWSAKVGFIAPVYFWRKERSAVAEAAYLLDGSKEEIADASRNLRYMIRENYAALKSSERLLSLYSKGIIPQARLAVDAALAGYRAGEADFTSLSDASEALLNFELEYWRKFVRHEKARAKLIELIGGELARADSPASNGGLHEEN
ncbi:MAG: TolC family protein [Deltaproteobacteria bacterium]